MDALEEKMAEDGYPMEEYLQDYLIELYCKHVPNEKQKAIDAALAQEKQQWVTPSM